MTSIPTQVTFRGLSHAPALDADIQDRADALARFYPRIIRCRVLVEVPHRHRRDGTNVHVRIEVTVPGGAPVVVNHDPSLHAGLKDIAENAHRKEADTARAHRHARVAVREAFDAAGRRLQDFAREQRGDVKTHESARGSSRTSGAE